MSNNIGVRMHGIRLNLTCDYDLQLEKTAALLGEHVCDPWPEPEIDVRVSWRVTTEPVRSSVFEVDHLEAFGKRMHVGTDELVWSDTYRNKDLQLRVRNSGGRWIHDVVYHYLPSKKKLAKWPDYEEKKFFDLLRYLVHFPIAWHMRRTQGWEMIHASAVTDGERAILVAGPGGAGKTTTAIALVANAGMRLMTENLLFYDGTKVHAVREPVRLTPESLELLGSAADHLRGYQAVGGLKKKEMFLPPADPDEPGALPAALFLGRFSEKGYVERLSPEVAHRQLVAANLLTLELNDFYWYSAALDFLWPSVPMNGDDPVLRLSRDVPCYTLGIDRTAGVEPVVQRVLECLEADSTNEAPLSAPHVHLEKR